MLGLARGLQPGVVAEGAETAAQMEALVAMDWDGAQGYHVSRPVPEAAVAALIAA